LKAAVGEDRPDVAVVLERRIVGGERLRATEDSTEQTQHEAREVKHDSRTGEEILAASSLTAGQGGRGRESLLGNRVRTICGSKQAKQKTSWKLNVERFWGR
jgi:hypothetical protein